MKLALIALVVLAGGCFSTRSNRFRCDVDTDCDPGRSCEGGFCTLGESPDAPNVDVDMAIDARPCTTDGLTCAGPVAHLDCGGVCWVTCDEDVSEPDADGRCTAWGGKLTPLRTQADVTCFEMVQLPDRMWLGLVQAPNQNDVATGWTWNGDGLPPAFFNWAPGGEPNDSDDTENNQENCAFVDNVDDKWNDKPCSTLFPFACSR